MDRRTLAPVSVAVSMVVATLLPSAGRAQGLQERFTAQSPRLTTHVFTLSHARASRVAAALAVFPGSFRHDDGLGVLTWSGMESSLQGVEAAVKKLDVVPPAEENVLLATRIVGLSRSGPSDIPAVLESVVERLGKTVGLTSARLLDTATLRVRSGASNAGAKGEFELGGDTATYQLVVRKVDVAQDQGGDSVRLEGVELSVGVQGPNRQNPTVKLGTEIDVRPGQQVVVGSASVNGSGDAVAFVISAEIVE